jgi:hypothetical protein
MHSPQTKAESGLAQAFCPQEGQQYLVLLRSLAPLPALPVSAADCQLRQKPVAQFIAVCSGLKTQS